MLNITSIAKTSRTARWGRKLERSCAEDDIIQECWHRWSERHNLHVIHYERCPQINIISTNNVSDLDVVAQLHMSRGVIEC